MRGSKRARGRAHTELRNGGCDPARGGTGLVPTLSGGWKGPCHPRGDSHLALLLSLGGKGNTQEVGSGGAPVPIPCSGKMLCNMVPGVPEAARALQKSGERLSRPRVLSHPLLPQPSAPRSWAEITPTPTTPTVLLHCRGRAEGTHTADSLSEVWMLLHFVGVCLSAQPRNKGPVCTRVPVCVCREVD